jgi:YHS domain-containing protein
MSMEDTIGYKAGVPACAVCGKNVENDRGFARIKRGQRMVELCSPLCLETFQKDPAPYIKRLQRVDYFRELSTLQTAPEEL